MASAKTSPRFVTATVAVQASRDLDVGDVDPGVPPAAAGVSMAPVQAKKRGRLRVAETQPDVTLQVGGLAVVPKLNVPPELITGDYSRGAGGFWISKGQITHPITEATIAGNLAEMFMQMTAANDIDLRDSVASPSLRLDSMMVAGS